MNKVLVPETVNCIVSTVLHLEDTVKGNIQNNERITKVMYIFQVFIYLQYSGYFTTFVFGQSCCLCDGLREGLIFKCDSFNFKGTVSFVF